MDEVGKSEIQELRNVNRSAVIVGRVKCWRWLGMWLKQEKQRMRTEFYWENVLETVNLGDQKEDGSWILG